MHHRELILRDKRPPAEKHLDTDLTWFCHAFGFQEPRDKGEVAIRLFHEFLDAAREGRQLTTKELMEHHDLSRGLTVYYLNKFIARGLVQRLGNKYELRHTNLENVVDELEKDASRTFATIRGIARELDDVFGLKKR
ncbi:MAG: hypothetical protein KKA90_02415 [Nanoarchaeota archaeon]|nr:hypothetical protein [Nanoarchaeota archaeon]